MRRLRGERVIILSLAVFLALYAAFFLFRAAAALSFPYPLLYGEGAVAATGQAWRSGVALYRDPAIPPYLSANYGPLAYLPAWTFPGPIALIAGRAASVAGALAIAAGLASLARRPRSWQIAVAGFWLALPPVYAWAAIAKPDLPALALSFWGLLLAPRRPALAGALIAIGVLTKPTALIALAALLPAAIGSLRQAAHSRPGQMKAFLFALLCLALSSSALEIATGGWFFRRVILLNLTTWSVDQGVQALGNFARQYWPLAGGAIVLSLFAVKSPPFRGRKRCGPGPEEPLPASGAAESRRHVGGAGGLGAPASLPAPDVGQDHDDGAGGDACGPRGAAPCPRGAAPSPSNLLRGSTGGQGSLVWITYLALAFLTLGVGVFKSGAFINYFLDPLLASVAVSAVAVRSSGVLAALVSPVRGVKAGALLGLAFIQLILCAHIPFHAEPLPTPSAADRDRGAAVLAAIAAIGDPWLAEDSGWLVAAGRPVWIDDPFYFEQLARSGAWNGRILETAIRERRFSAALLDFDPSAGRAPGFHADRFSEGTVRAILDAYRARESPAGFTIWQPDPP